MSAPLDIVLLQPLLSHFDDIMAYRYMRTEVKAALEECWRGDARWTEERRQELGLLYGVSYEELRRHRGLELANAVARVHAGRSPGEEMVTMPWDRREVAAWFSRRLDREWPADPDRKRTFVPFLSENHRTLHAVLTALDYAPPRDDAVFWDDRALACPILLLGPSGVGKELVARAVHEKSGLEGKFVALNCGAIPDELLETELFGFERGAFTGADTMRPGHVESARGGTLFLDEIGEMSPRLQAALLRFLNSGEFFRVGGRELKRVETRIIAATKRDLDKMVEAGEFRDDLFHRLGGTVSVKIPGLKEDRDSIEPLLRRFIDRTLAEGRRPRLSPSASRALREYDWPGNMREMRLLVDRWSRRAHTQEDPLVGLWDLPRPAIRAYFSAVKGYERLGLQTLDELAAGGNPDNTAVLARSNLKQLADRRQRVPRAMLEEVRAIGGLLGMGDELEPIARHLDVVLGAEAEQAYSEDFLGPVGSHLGGEEMRRMGLDRLPAGGTGLGPGVQVELSPMVGMLVKDLRAQRTRLDAALALSREFRADRRIAVMFRALGLGIPEEFKQVVVEVLGEIVSNAATLRVEPAPTWEEAKKDPEVFLRVYNEAEGVQARCAEVLVVTRKTVRAHLTRLEAEGVELPTWRGRGRTRRRTDPA